MSIRTYSTFTLPVNKHNILQKLATKEKSISHYVPYSHLVSESIIKTNNNQYLATIELSGISFETTDYQDINEYKNALHNSLQAIIASIPNISFWSHLVREKLDIELGGTFNNTFCKNLNVKYLQKFATQQSYSNRLFLTLVILEQENDTLKTINDTLSQLNISLGMYQPVVLTTYTENNILYSKQLEFYAYLLAKEWNKIPVVSSPINSYIALNKIFFTNENIEIATINKKTIGAVLDIKEYSNESTPEHLNDFLSMPFELTITQSFLAIEKIKAQESLRVQQSHLISSKDYSTSQTEQLSVALDDISSGNLVLGESHCNVFIWGDSQQAVNNNLAKAKKVLSDTGFIPKIVSPLPECAFFASLPANFKYRLRPSPITSKNFVCFANFHNFFSGKANNNSWGNAITIFETDNLTPVYFNFHEESNKNQLGDKDLGNTFIAGRSGAGKTVIANFLLTNLDKFNTTTIFFDKDKGTKIALLAMGGQYFDLELGQKTGWNPLQLNNTPENVIFLNLLFKTMLCHSDRTVTISQEKELANSINTLMSIDTKDRSLQGLVLSLPCINPDDVGSRLKEWVNNGQYAWLFDNANDTLDLNANNIIGFDCTEFLDHSTIRTPLMMYLLHRMEQVIDGRRFTCFMDEFWKLLSDDIFIDFAKNKLKTIRKQNGLCVFMTQEPDDALSSKIGKTIVQQVATQILLSNPKADKADYTEGLKLSEEEFDLVKSFSVESRKFLIKKSKTSAVAKLNLYGFDEIKVLSGDVANTILVEELIKQGFTTEQWIEKLYASQKG
jgi:type IV secretion system protein VirB4